MKSVDIAAIGSCLGSVEYTNEKLLVDKKVAFDADYARDKNPAYSGLSDREIFDAQVQALTGIKKRHFIDAAAGESTESMMAKACEIALSKAGLGLGDVDYIVAATSSPFTDIPNPAVTLTHMLGCEGKPGHTIDTACSGFHYAVSTAREKILSDAADTVLVVNGEALSMLLDFNDFKTAILLGDGAAATVVRRAEAGGIPHTPWMSSNYSLNIFLKGVAGNLPAEDRYVMRRFLAMEGGTMVLRAATRAMVRAAHGALANEAFGWRYYRKNQDFFTRMLGQPKMIDERLPGTSTCMEEMLGTVDYIGPHQANQRIIDNVAERLLDPEHRKTISIISDIGNISGVTSPMLLERLLEGRLEGYEGNGSRILMTAVGGGYTMAGFILDRR